MFKPKIENIWYRLYTLACSANYRGLISFVTLKWDFPNEIKQWNFIIEATKWDFLTANFPTVIKFFFNTNFSSGNHLPKESSCSEWRIVLKDYIESNLTLV